MSCDCYCSVALPHGAVSWSAVCDCDISQSNSLAFLKNCFSVSVSVYNIIDIPVDSALPFQIVLRNDNLSM